MGKVSRNGATLATGEWLGIPQSPVARLEREEVGEKGVEPKACQNRSRWLSEADTTGMGLEKRILKRCQKCFAFDSVGWLGEEIGF